jgi:DNA gyrase subunit A
MSKQKHAGSDYVLEQRKVYSLYTLESRAIPHAADGLKAAARRVLWTARDGKTYKSATLAGATMPIHPHASPETTINTLAAYYANNIPLLKGDGAFGTLLKPGAFGASRYTSAAVSAFTKDVVFRDIEIIPMVENYDGSLMEPKHFLPLVPVVLINPQEGIAVGFASSILPRDPASVIKHQIGFLEGKTRVKNPAPTLHPLSQISPGTEVDRLGTEKWVFKGTFERKDAVTVVVTNLPYGLDHEKFIERLIKFEDEGKIQEHEDNSKNVYNITIRFKKGELKPLTDDQVISYLGLSTAYAENFTVIDFDGERVWEAEYSDFVQKFTEWRLKWYLTRYQRLANLLEEEIQRYRDVLIAIAKNLGSVARKTESRSELKELCEAFGIVNVDYIADLPVYRFTEEEKRKTEKKIEEAEVLLKHYYSLIKSEQKRKDVYIEELKEILQKISKGHY